MHTKRKSTIVRNNQVHDIYNELKEQYGSNVFYNLSRTFIYEEIGKRMGLCVKTIANILNHYRSEK